MLGIFNRTNQKQELRTFETGLNGTLADIRTAAQMGGNWEYKREDGSISNIETQSLDGGLTHLVGKPLVHLLERQKNPAQTLEILTEEMSAYYKQMLLDIVLRHAANQHSWMVVPVLLAAGADINTGRGRPLFSALRNGNLRMAHILIDAGADVDMALRLAAREDDDDDITAATQTLRLLRGDTDTAAQDNFETGTPPVASSPRTIIKKPEGPHHDGR